MSNKKILAALIAAAASVSFAAAQTNLQTFYDFGKNRKYVTTTFEMFKADKFGDTFFFIDHYYATSDQRDNGTASAINGSYFEIERNLNFWQNSDLKDLSAHVEYDGSTWGAGVFCVGASYFLHSADFSKTFTVALMYDAHIGVGEADVPLKFTGVWGMNDIFGVKGLCFKGFIDIWGNNNSFLVDSKLKDTKVSILSEPQIWYNLGDFFDGHLDLGAELELSLNFAGNYGFMANPCIGARWSF